MDIKRNKKLAISYIYKGIYYSLTIAFVIIALRFRININVYALVGNPSTDLQC
jgi:3-deoxy-D-manno-octulosonate 8-phosphate phosphatase KdsC-like HAD superfamily phosphatase